MATDTSSRTLVKVTLGSGPLPEIFIDRALLRAAVLGILFGTGYLIIGLIVAANRDFLSNLDSLSGLASAAGAILFWPLPVLGIGVSIPA